jgi:hypothetical protein
MPLHELAPKEPYHQRRSELYYRAEGIEWPTRKEKSNPALMKGFLRSSDSAQRHQITLIAPLQPKPESR